MKSSLKKLRGLGLHRHGHGDAKERRDPPPSLVQFDELAKASQDMHDMRDCYDSLLSAAAATANSAYEFSESLREMGTCLLEKTALNDDEESGKVLLKLGKVQFELQKLVNNYRSHIFQTITSPSESLLNELRTVEEMKHQCDEKRDVYDYMMQRQKGKGRSKSMKGESFSMQQVKAANDEYDEEATLFIFRLKSLKQGQSRSLLSQAARHHAAQLWFFKKALKSLETVDPHVKSVTEQQHIDYHFRGLEDEADEGDDYDYDTQDDGELSFDYGHSDQDKDVSTSQNSMELDQDEVTFPSVAAEEVSKENFGRLSRKSFSFREEIRASSQSAPLLFAENKSNPLEKLLQMRPSSTKKFNTYVLPTPVDSKPSPPKGSGSPVPRTPQLSLSASKQNLWHSSPLEAKKFDKFSDEKFPVLKESNNNTASTSRLPPPLADRLLFSRPDLPSASDSKKLKRHAFSGPLTSKPWSGKAVPVEHPQLFSGPLLRNPLPQSPSTSPKVSPNASPTFLSSSPKISEPHELPRPPKSYSPTNFSRPSGMVGYSAPLGLKGRFPSAPRKPSESISASPLPKPPNTVTRSFSIPSEGHRVSDSDMTGDVRSPPLTPISLYDVQPSTTGSKIDDQDIQIKGSFVYPSQITQITFEKYQRRTQFLGIDCSGFQNQWRMIREIDAPK